MSSHELQRISTKDVDRFATDALLQPEDARNRGVALTAAVDELTGLGANEVYKQMKGKGMLLMACLTGSDVGVVNKKIGDMFRWTEKSGTVLMLRLFGGCIMS